MKKSLLSVLAMVGLSCCVQQSMPAWEDLPGDNCTLSVVSPRLLKTKADAASSAKPVTLRESEKEQVRAYLREFAEQGERSHATYAQRTVFSGEYFSLNFVEDWVILSIGKKERTQYARHITQQDKDMRQLLRKRSDSRALKN